MPIHFKYVCIPITFILAIGITLGFHVKSDCPRGYITWGSLLLGLYFCLSAVEMAGFLVKHCISEE